MKQLSLFILLMLALISCNDIEVKTQNKRVSYASLDSNNYYVGIETCGSCHQDHYKSFQHTGMGLSYEDAHQGKSVISKGSVLDLYDENQNLNYKIYWEKDSLVCLEYRVLKGDTIHHLKVKVDDVIGSGHHTNSHIKVRNGYAYQMPFTFYVQDSLVDLPPGFDKGANSRFFRQIDVECMTCHNSYPEHEKGSINKFKNVPNGINCERCHGPGGLHVEEKKKGLIVDIDKEVDYSIVNPAKLELDLQFAICQRCHLQGNTVLEEGKSFYDFIPGMDLKEVLSVYLPRYEGDSNNFIMASHVDRMQMSRCFIESKKQVSENNLYPTEGQMTCIRCHNPHHSVKETGTQIYDAACMSCHQEKTCSANHISNCSSCHMPKSSAIDIPHVSITDHFIRKKPALSQSNKKGKFQGLVSVNNSNSSERSRLQAYINQFDKFDSNPVLLDSAYKISEGMSFHTDNVPALVHLYYTNKDLKSMMSLLRNKEVLAVLNSYTESSHENYEAWTLFRVGDLLMEAKLLSQSERYYSKAIKLAPFILEFRNKLATLFFQQGRFDEAEKEWKFIVTEDQMHYQSWSNLAFLAIQKGDSRTATNYIEKALNFNPDYLKAWENCYLLGELTKNRELQKKALKQIVRLNPNNIQAKQYLKTFK